MNLSSIFVNVQLSAGVVASAIVLIAALPQDEHKSNKEAVTTTIHKKYGDGLNIARGLMVVTAFKEEAREVMVVEEEEVSSN